VRLATPLLFDLARGVDVQQIGAVESTLELPPAVLPIVELPLAQLPTVSFNVLDPQRASFFQHAALIRTNQVDSTVTICTFGAGLWYLFLSLWFVSNFDAFTAAGNGARILLGDSTAALRPLLQMEPVIAGGPHVQDILLRALFPDDGWVLQLNVFTTGVGQTSHAKASVTAAKLL